MQVNGVAGLFFSRLGIALFRLILDAAFPFPVFSSPASLALFCELFQSARWRPLRCIGLLLSFPSKDVWAIGRSKRGTLALAGIGYGRQYRVVAPNLEASTAYCIRLTYTPSTGGLMIETVG